MLFIDIQRAVTNALVVVVVNAGETGKNRQCHASERVGVRFNTELETLSPPDARQVPSSRLDLVAASGHRGEGVGHPDRDEELGPSALNVGVLFRYHQIVLC